MGRHRLNLMRHLAKVFCDRFPLLMAQFSDILFQFFQHRFLVAPHSLALFFPVVWTYSQTFPTQVVSKDFPYLTLGEFLMLQNSY